MTGFYIPAYQDLAFRRKMLGDPETMSYNHAWGGTVSFEEEQWKEWYDHWIIHHEGKRFYRYVIDEHGSFAGEAAYHYDAANKMYIADVIIYAPFRNRGFGSEALELLSKAAAENGIEDLYDTIAADNPAVSMFLKHGFVIVSRTDEIITVKRDLKKVR